MIYLGFSIIALLSCCSGISAFSHSLAGHDYYLRLLQPCLIAVSAPTTLLLTSSSVCSSVAIFTGCFYRRSRSTFIALLLFIQVFHPSLDLEAIPVLVVLYSGHPTHIKLFLYCLPPFFRCVSL